MCFRLLHGWESPLISITLIGHRLLIIEYYVTRIYPLQMDSSCLCDIWTVFEMHLTLSCVQFDHRQRSELYISIFFLQEKQKCAMCISVNIFLMELSINSLPKWLCGVGWHHKHGHFVSIVQSGIVSDRTSMFYLLFGHSVVSIIQVCLFLVTVQYSKKGYHCTVRQMQPFDFTVLSCEYISRCFESR